MDNADTKVDEAKSSVDGMSKLLAESKLVEQGKEAQKQLETKINNVADQTAEEINKVQDKVQLMVKEKKEDLEKLKKKVAESTPKVVDALKAGFSAFTDSLHDKKDE